MVDEMFDRNYQHARQALNGALSDGLTDLRRTVRQAFNVLVRIEYDAPWAKRRRGARNA